MRSKYCFHLHLEIVSGAGNILGSVIKMQDLVLYDRAQGALENVCLIINRHALRVVIFARIALANIPHHCGGVGVIVWASECQELVPQFPFIFSHPLLADCVM